MVQLFTVLFHDQSDLPSVLFQKGLKANNSELSLQDSKLNKNSGVFPSF